MSANEAYNPVALMYNPDRWKKISIGRQTVGPMGILPISAQLDANPAVEQFCRNGQLVKIADLNEDQMVAQPVALPNHPAWTRRRFTRSTTSAKEWNSSC